MYDFHYNYIKPKYGGKAKLLLTDTDSLIYEIETEDFYGDIREDVKARFDTSDYPPNHLSGIPSGFNKKKLGVFKDEMAGEVIEEFVGLRAKLYSYKMFESQESKKCKGVKKSVIKKAITHEDYKKCLFSGNSQLRKMNVIRSRKHEIFTEEVNKVVLCPNDDKRHKLEDGVHTLALGHIKIGKQKHIRIGKQYILDWEIPAEMASVPFLTPTAYTPPPPPQASSTDVEDLLNYFETKRPKKNLYINKILRLKLKDLTEEINYIYINRLYINRLYIY